MRNCPNSNGPVISFFSLIHMDYNWNRTLKWIVMSNTDDLERLKNKIDHKTVWEYIDCVSDYYTVSVLCFEVKLCPEIGNSDRAIIKLWLLE